MPINVTLASSLLELEADQYQYATEAGGRSFRTGIETLDRDLPSSLWRGGDIVGVGSDMSSISSNKTDSLPLEIIVTHLLDAQTTSSHKLTSDSTPNTTTPSVFIVAPPTQATTSIQQIYTKLNTRLLNTQPQQQRLKQQTSPATKNTTPSQITTQTKSLLTRISLLQYLDISGLNESISEILSTITTTTSQTPQQQPQKTIILVQSLPQTLTTTHRRTGTLQTTALLTSLLQSLRNITRISAGTCLILVELDVNWSGGQAHSVGVGVASPSVQPPPALRTAFSSRAGKTLRVNSGAVFARMLEEGMDVLVALHDGEGRVGKTQMQGRDRSRRIVECVRDERVGREVDDDGGFGVWSVWGE